MPTPTNTEVGIFKKAVSRVAWGSTPWYTVLEDIISRWDDYLTRFAWRTYNHMPGAPDLQFIAFNLKYFVKYQQEPSLVNDRAVRLLEKVNEAKDEARKQQTPRRSTAVSIDRNDEEIIRLRSLSAKLQADLNMVSEELKNTIEANRKLYNWAKSKGYSEEDNILDAIFGDYELPSKIK